MNNNNYNDHLEDCKQCREHPLTPCETGTKALRATVEQGQGGEYERILDRQVNANGGDQ